MSPRTEEFLYFLLWGAETLARPTFRNLTGSYEGWARRTSLLRQLQRLEQGAFIERNPESPAGRIYRLTEVGRLHALGGRDPEAHWNRSWDGMWRTVIFDLPESRNASRVRLRRFLKSRGFGYLQNSVWVTPHRLDATLKEMAALGQDVESFVTFEGRPCAGERDAAIVNGAWDFRNINRRYQRCMRLLQELPQEGGHVGAPNKLKEWAGQERAAWLDAAGSDPFLPNRLWPSQYLGRDVWRLRTQVLRNAGRWLND